MSRVARRAAVKAEIAAVDREIETAEMTGDEEKLLARVAARQDRRPGSPNSEAANRSFFLSCRRRGPAYG
jgi:hypothetical protein